MKERIEDLREEFITSYIWPTLRAGAVYEHKYLLGTSFARPVLAKAQVKIPRARPARTGLSGISLRDFVKVNVLAGVPGAFLLYVIFLNSKNITSGLIAHYWIGAILTIIWVFINHNRKHRKQ